MIGIELQAAYSTISPQSVEVFEEGLARLYGLASLANQYLPPGKTVSSGGVGTQEIIAKRTV